MTAASQQPNEADLARGEVIHDLAELLAGLQVPRSIDGTMMLGAGCKAFDRLNHRARFGWKTTEDFETMLRANL